MPPSRLRVTDTQSPSPRLACLAIASGIRTARLFPHFEIVDSLRIRIYFEYTLVLIEDFDDRGKVERVTIIRSTRERILAVMANSRQLALKVADSIP
ncbi:MAG: hypothetical protein P4L56_15195 [Candidatus Sulfopaludibacter sp.]|nr:hypothetical protein [Candidatus Sulfopaludibacter sp.]